MNQEALVMMASRERHKEVLEDKAEQLRLASRGKCRNKARQVSEEKEEILWKSGKLEVITQNL